MSQTYELAFYQNDIYTGGYIITGSNEAIDEYIGCIDRYTQTHGFYTEHTTDDTFVAVDLSPDARLIKLIGINDDMKNTIKKLLNARFLK